MRRHARHVVLVAFALLVGGHLVMLAPLALDPGPRNALPLLLLTGAALYGLCALVLAWGGLVRGHGAALVGAFVALALYSAAALVVTLFPDSDSASPGDNPLPRVALYLALLWTLALIGFAARRRPAVGAAPGERAPG